MKETGTISYHFHDLNIKAEQLQQLLGFQSGDTPDPFSSMIGDVLDDASGWTDINGGYRIISAIATDYGNHSFRIQDIMLSPGSTIFRRLKGIRHVAVFVCTAGKGIGAWARNLTESGDNIKAYIIDVLGTLIVETAVEKIQNRLKKEMKQAGLYITNRYSPGFCGWDIREQQKLFKLLPEKYCGIELLPSSLMNPIKSVSGIIGIGEKVKRMPYACHLCNDANCIYKNLKELH